MSNVNAPRGFKLARDAGGRPFNGATNQYHLASGYGTNIFVGDAVKLVSGKIQKAGASDEIIGVFAGVMAPSAATPALNPFLNYWPASYATLGGNDAVALVYDDPDLIFEAQFTNSTSVPAVADIGSYFDLIDNGGSTSSGLSGEGIDYTTKNSSSSGLVWVFVDFVQRPNNDTTSAYSRGLFRPILHAGRVNGGAS